MSIIKQQKKILEQGHVLALEQQSDREEATCRTRVEKTKPTAKAY